MRSWRSMVDDYDVMDPGGWLLDSHPVLCSYMVNLRFLMLQAGDIESNPGPTNMDDEVDTSIRRAAIDSEGTCSKCKIAAGSDFMKCFGCEELFHVINCTGEKQVTKTFLDSTWPTMCKLYNNIQFICDACKHDKQIKKDIIVSNRMCLMEEHMKSLIGMINDIKISKPEQADIAKLVKNNNDLTVELEKLRTTVSNLVEKTVPGQNTVSNAPKTYAEKAKAEKSVLVIKKNANGESAKMEDVQQVAVDTGSAVTTAYTNLTGDTVVICENHNSQEKMKPALERTMSNFTIVSPPARKPTINIAGIATDYTKENLFKVIQTQNRDRGLMITEDNFKIIFTKKHAREERLFMAVVRVSDDIRNAIKGAGDRICVGSIACPVYDRFFVRRCNFCQGLNHWKDDCKQDIPSCGKCSGQHETNACNSESRKCINCVTSGFQKNNHETSW